MHSVGSSFSDYWALIWDKPSLRCPSLQKRWVIHYRNLLCSMKGCTSGFLCKWALRLQGKYHPPCRLGVVSLGLSKNTCMLALALLLYVFCPTLERKESSGLFRQTLYPLLNIEVFMGNSEYILFVWWGGKRWKCKVAMAADVVSPALWLLYHLKGEGGQSQKLRLRNRGCHPPLWLEEMLLRQALAWPWPYNGPALLLPPWGWRELELWEQQHLQRASFLSRNSGWPLKRAFLLAEGAHRKQGPGLPATQSPSHAPQCFLMAAGLGFRPQQDTQVPCRLFMLSLESRISPNLKICFLLAFSLHKIYICFYYICSSKKGTFENSFLPFPSLFSLLICNHFRNIRTEIYHSPLKKKKKQKKNWCLWK